MERCRILGLDDAIKQLQSGDWNGAISTLKTVPPSFQVCNLSGVAHQMSQDWDGAVASWLNALTYNPSSEDVRLNLGIAFIALGRKQEAERQWLTILEANSTHVQSLINLGLMNREQNKNQSAHDYWERALKILPTHPKVIEWLADVKGVLGFELFELGNIKEATSLLNQAASMDPTHGLLWWFLSKVHIHNQEYEIAYTACQKAVDLEPGNEDYNRTLLNINRYRRC